MAARASLLLQLHWAQENTREAIWDAFKREEVQETAGLRITVRVFARPEGAAPTFMIRALRDPDGVNLDRIQIVKGWVDDSGEPRTKVFDAAWSGGPDDAVMAQQARACTSPIWYALEGDQK